MNDHADGNSSAILVDVVEAGERPRTGHVPCVIGENITFTTRSLETYCLSNWQPVIFDALLVAAAVEFCDRIKRRPALGWARRIRLRIAVHEPDRWGNAETLASLVDALDFVTGDRWDLTFRARKRAEAAPHQTTLAMPSGVDAVIPFSNGLDSFAVATLMSQDLSDRILRVRLGPAGDRDTLDKYKEPFASIPYRIRHGLRSVETSARSRGFKFAMISGLAVYLVGAGTIIVPESGQGALGPSLVPVGHAYEDFRNHPLFTQRMAKFLTALFGHPVVFKFPRLWYTKGETLRQFLASGGDATALLSKRSCWQDRRKVSLDHKMRQCGICAACMLRRMSLHAAGLSEASGTYVWEDLSRASFEDATPSGIRKGKRRDAQREYAIAGTLHLDHLAHLLESEADAEPVGRRADELGEALTLPARDANTKMRRLLNAHAAEWAAFLADLKPRSFILNWTAKPHEYAA